MEPSTAQALLADGTGSGSVLLPNPESGAWDGGSCHDLTWVELTATGLEYGEKEVYVVTDKYKVVLATFDDTYGDVVVQMGSLGTAFQPLLSAVRSGTVRVLDPRWVAEYSKHAALLPLDAAQKTTLRTQSTLGYISTLGATTQSTLKPLVAQPTGRSKWYAVSMPMIDGDFIQIDQYGWIKDDKGIINEAYVLTTDNPTQTRLECARQLVASTTATLTLHAFEAVDGYDVEVYAPPLGELSQATEDSDMRVFLSPEATNNVTIAAQAFATGKRATIVVDRNSTMRVAENKNSTDTLQPAYLGLLQAWLNMKVARDSANALLSETILKENVGVAFPVTGKEKWFVEQVVLPGVRLNQSRDILAVRDNDTAVCGKASVLQNNLVFKGATVFTDVDTLTEKQEESVDVYKIKTLTVNADCGVEKTQRDKKLQQTRRETLVNRIVQEAGRQNATPQTLQAIARAESDISRDVAADIRKKTLTISISGENDKTVRLGRYVIAYWAGEDLGERNFWSEGEVTSLRLVGYDALIKENSLNDLYDLLAGLPEEVTVTVTPTDNKSATAVVIATYGGNNPQNNLIVRTCNGCPNLKRICMPARLWDMYTHGGDDLMNTAWEEAFNNEQCFALVPESTAPRALKYTQIMLKDLAMAVAGYGVEQAIGELENRDMGSMQTLVSKINRASTTLAPQQLREVRELEKELTELKGEIQRASKAADLLRIAQSQEVDDVFRRYKLGDKKQDIAELIRQQATNLVHENIETKDQLDLLMLAYGDRLSDFDIKFSEDVLRQDVPSVGDEDSKRIFRDAKDKRAITSGKVIDDSRAKELGMGDFNRVNRIAKNDIGFADAEVLIGLRNDLMDDDDGSDFSRTLEAQLLRYAKTLTECKDGHVDEALWYLENVRNDEGSMVDLLKKCQLTDTQVETALRVIRPSAASDFAKEEARKLIRDGANPKRLAAVLAKVEDNTMDDQVVKDIKTYGLDALETLQSYAKNSRTDRLLLRAKNELRAAVRDGQVIDDDIASFIDVVSENDVNRVLNQAALTFIDAQKLHNRMDLDKGRRDDIQNKLKAFKPNTADELLWYYLQIDPRPDVLTTLAAETKTEKEIRYALGQLRDAAGQSEYAAAVTERLLESARSDQDIRLLMDVFAVVGVGHSQLSDRMESFMLNNYDYFSKHAPNPRDDSKELEAWRKVQQDIETRIVVNGEVPDLPIPSDLVDAVTVNRYAKKELTLDQAEQLFRIAENMGGPVRDRAEERLSRYIEAVATIETRDDFELALNYIKSETLPFSNTVAESVKRYAISTEADDERAKEALEAFVSVSIDEWASQLADVEVLSILEDLDDGMGVATEDQAVRLAYLYKLMTRRSRKDVIERLEPIFRDSNNQAAILRSDSSMGQLFQAYAREDELSALRERVERQKSEAARATEELDQKNEELQRKETNILSLQKQVQEASQRLDVLNRTNFDAQKAAELAGRDAAAARKLTEQQQVAIGELQEQLGTSERELKESKTRQRQIQELSDIEKSRKDGLLAENEERIRTQTAEARAAREQLKSLRAAQESAEQVAAAAEERLRTVAEQRAVAQKQLEAAKEDQGRLETQLDTAEEARGQLETEMARLVSEKEQLQESLTTARAAELGMQSEITVLRRKIEQQDKLMNANPLLISIATDTRKRARRNAQALPPDESTEFMFWGAAADADPAPNVQLVY